MSSDMRPCFPGSDSPYMRFVNAESESEGGYFFLGSLSVQGSNLQDMFISKFGKRVTGSRCGWLCATFAGSSLCGAILHVIRACSQKQMSRMKASRLIAVVANIYAAWNWTLSLFKSESMGAGHLAVLPRNMDSAISLLLASRPNHAGVSHPGLGKIAWRIGKHPFEKLEVSKYLVHVTTVYQVITAVYVGGI